MRKLALFISLSILPLSSCSTHEQILKSKDVNLKFTKANEYYDQGKWAKAGEVYERLLPVFRGTKNYEELYYRYAYTFYNRKDYLSASYQFKNFTDLFPRSSRADECEFMYATCLFKMSPRYSLDQTNTKKAMEVLQSYINTHPESKNLTLANSYIEICRAKLERKDKEAAQLYFDMGEYKSASVAYKSLIQSFPESVDIEFYQLMIIKSYFNFANSSVRAKQEERYSEALNAYAELKEYHPKSNYIKEAEPLATKAQNAINQIRNDNK